MNKQPVLTGFPCSVFATAKRRLQAAIRQRRANAIRDSLCGYAMLFEPFLPASFLRENDPTVRNRHFGHIPVFWAWIAQILEANASCTKAVSLIQAWSRAAGLPVPEGSSSGYCQARQRIRMDFLQSILARINASLGRHHRPCDLWHGHILKAIDGSSVQLMDTEENQRAFPQPSGQKPGCGFPTMGIVAIHNLSHGGWEGFVTSPHAGHDSTKAPRLLSHIGENDILLGDRAFCSYELIALLQGKTAHAVMRLHQARHAKLDWRKGRKLSPIERLVTWVKPTVPPSGSTLTKEQWAALPGKLTLRYIKLGYEDRCGGKRMLVVVTTLLDPVKYEAGQVADLYARRWDIELKLRDIKTTLRMERLAVLSPDMAQRTTWMMFIAANLLRSLMKQSGEQAGVAVWQVSFKGILDQAVASQESYLTHRGKPRSLQQHHSRVITTCSTKLINIRPYRQEPRAIKRRPKNYPLLTSPRHQFREIPHRGNPRSAA